MDDFERGSREALEHHTLQRLLHGYARAGLPAPAAAAFERIRIGGHTPSPSDWDARLRAHTTAGDRAGARAAVAARVAARVPPAMATFAALAHAYELHGNAGAIVRGPPGPHLPCTWDAWAARRRGRRGGRGRAH